MLMLYAIVSRESPKPSLSPPVSSCDAAGRSTPFSSIGDVRGAPSLSPPSSRLRSPTSSTRWLSRSASPPLRNWSIKTVERSDRERDATDKLGIQHEGPDSGSIKFCPRCGQELVFAEVDGRRRQRCPSDICEYVFWDNPTPVIAAIVERDGNIVLVRNKAWPGKIFGLVTGFLEKGETPEEAAVNLALKLRETKIL